MIQEEDHPSIYNIEEISDVFPFNLCNKEVSRKKVQSVKQNDETVKEVQEDEIRFEKIDEDLVTVTIASTSLTQATTRNVIMLNQKLLRTKYENIKLKDEIISF